MERVAYTTTVLLHIRFSHSWKRRIRDIPIHQLWNMRVDVAAACSVMTTPVLRHDPRTRLGSADNSPQHLLSLVSKGRICRFTKWQIRPFETKVRICPHKMAGVHHGLCRCRLIVHVSWGALRMPIRSESIVALSVRGPTLDVRIWRL